MINFGGTAKALMQLLTTKGRGLVLPRFSSGTAKSKDAKIRQITNWLFEEAFEKPKKITDPPDDESYNGFEE